MKNFIFKIPLVGTLIALIYFLYKHIGLKRLLDKIYIKEDFIRKLSLILSIPIRKDLAGRLYGVLNPAKEEMNEETALLIYEIKDNGTLDNTSFVEQWVYKKLNVLNDILINESMLDLLYINVKHVGPKEYDNYLLTLTPFYFNDFLFYLHKLKNQLKWLCSIIIIFVMGYLLWKYIY